MNKIVEQCENNIFLYADNSTIFAPITSSNRFYVAASLYKDLENIRRWADAWKVTFEPSNCKAVILTDLFFGSTRIGLSEQLEVLCLCINSKLT